MNNHLEKLKEKKKKLREDRGDIFPREDEIRFFSKRWLFSLKRSHTHTHAKCVGESQRVLTVLPYE